MCVFIYTKPLTVISGDRILTSYLRLYDLVFCLITERYSMGVKEHVHTVLWVTATVFVVSTFRLLWITLMQTFMYKYLCWNMFHFLGSIPRSRITGWCGNSLFKNLRKCQTVFQSSWIILHFHQQYVGVVIYIGFDPWICKSYPCHHFLSFLKNKFVLWTKEPELLKNFL